MQRRSNFADKDGCRSLMPLDLEKIAILPARLYEKASELV
jgi:hypothetical protein